jgi:hypothetical protein
LVVRFGLKRRILDERRTREHSAGRSGREAPVDERRLGARKGATEQRVANAQQ